MMRKLITEFPGKGWMVSCLNKLKRKMSNAGNTIRRQESGWPQCAHWWQRLFCQRIDFESGRRTKESQNHTSNFRRDRNSSLFSIPYRSSEFEVEMLEKASCARTHCCKLCIAPNSRM